MPCLKVVLARRGGGVVLVPDPPGGEVVMKVFINIQVGARKLKSAITLSIIVTVGEWLQLEVDLTILVKSVPAKSTIARNDGMLVPRRTPLLFWTDYVVKWDGPECS